MDYSGIIDEFTTLARAEYPREACGLVTVFRGRARLVPCENRAADPLADFEIAPHDFADAEMQGDVVGVIHSHPGTGGAPSPLDAASHAASGLTWWIVGLPEPDAPANVVTLPPANELPLLGREFVHGVTDCFALVRDWYWRELGVSIPDFRREDEWWHKGQNLYEDNWQAAGLLRIGQSEPARVGDILVMNIGAAVGNHGAILVSDNVILHHLHGRLSCQEVYTGFYRDRTLFKLRAPND